MVEESKDGIVNSYEVKSNRVEGSKFQEEVTFESHEKFGLLEMGKWSVQADIQEPGNDMISEDEWEICLWVGDKFGKASWRKELVSYCCCNRWPQTKWLHTMQIYSPTALEARSLKWVLQG